MAQWAAVWGESFEYEWLGTVRKDLSGSKRFLDPYVSDGVFVDNLVFVARELIERRVNELLPTFVREKFDFVLKITQVQHWEFGPKCRAYLRLRNTENDQISDYMHGSDPNLDRRLQMQLLFTDEMHGSDPDLERRLMLRLASIDAEDEIGWLIPIEASGSGIFRWVVAVLTMVTNGLVRGSVDWSPFWEQVSDAETEDMDDRDEAEYWRLTVLGDFEKALLVSVPFDLSNTVLIVDEPEAQLHPGGLSSITLWLQDRAVQCGGTFLATHSAQIFDIETPRMTRFVMTGSRRQKRANCVKSLEVDVSAMSEWADELGISKGELYLFTKRWLVVEGEVDKRVLQIWFSDLFARKGVRCLQARGARNVKLLGQVDILAGIASNISVLLDKPTPAGDNVDHKILRKEIANNLLINDLRSDGRVIRFGSAEHSQYDMWFYMDPQIVKEVTDMSFSGVPDVTPWVFISWSDAWSRFEKWCLVEDELGLKSEKRKPRTLSMTKFKEFMNDQTGLQFGPDEAEKIARIQRDKGQIPNELFLIVDSITERYFGESL